MRGTGAAWVSASPAGTKASVSPTGVEALPSPRRRARVFHMKGWLLLLVLACTPALTFGHTLRCSDKLISEGSTSHELATLCGEPAQIEHKTIYSDVSAGVSNVVAGSTTE